MGCALDGIAEAAGSIEAKERKPSLEKRHFFHLTKWFKAARACLGFIAHRLKSLSILVRSFVQKTKQMDLPENVHYYSHVRLVIVDLNLVTVIAVDERSQRRDDVVVCIVITIIVLDGGR
jgi:hypothetical protein